ncbi:MAG TPA: hypothetical protein VJL60_05350, partial [Gammaproteobacteria bacterium]|nr:hypothetical protein [Gammaproteobacteria bacterium]
MADQPDLNKFGDNTPLTFYAASKINHLRIQIPLPTVVVKRTKSCIPENIETDRHFVIDAALVRIMKDRK